MKKTITEGKTREKVVLELNREDILDLLQTKGLITKEQARTGDVDFLVPSGGDYSGRYVDIDSEAPITVTYRT